MKLKYLIYSILLLFLLMLKVQVQAQEIQQQPTQMKYLKISEADWISLQTDFSILKQKIKIEREISEAEIKSKTALIFIKDEELSSLNTYNEKLKSTNQVLFGIGITSLILNVVLISISVFK